MKNLARLERIVERMDKAPDGSVMRRMLANPLPEDCACPNGDEIHLLHHIVCDMWWLLEQIAKGARS